MPNGDDHDLLVKLSTKMNDLCSKTERYQKENAQAHDKIMDKIDKNLETTNTWVSDVHGRIDSQIKDSTNRVEKCHDTFVKTKLFYWVIGFVIAGIVSAWGTVIMFGDKFDSRIDGVEILIEKTHPGISMEDYTDKDHVH